MKIETIYVFIVSLEDCLHKHDLNLTPIHLRYAIRV